MHFIYLSISFYPQPWRNVISAIWLWLFFFSRLYSRFIVAVKSNLIRFSQAKEWIGPVQMWMKWFSAGERSFARKSFAHKIETKESCAKKWFRIIPWVVSVKIWWSPVVLVICENFSIFHSHSSGIFMSKVWRETDE